jgi:hypothetical protein
MIKLCLLIVCILNTIYGNIITSAINRALKQTLYEQDVEDLNAIHKIDNHLVRRLIVLPLTDAFNPNLASAMFGKVQYG